MPDVKNGESINGVLPAAQDQIVLVRVAVEDVPR